MISNPYKIREFTSSRHQQTGPQTPPEAVYLAALRLVERIDENVTRGVVHYRTKAGRLLETLDEVIRAILEDELMEAES